MSFASAAACSVQSVTKAAPMFSSFRPGTVQASHLYTQNLTATNSVRLGGYTCVWKKLTVVTSVSLSKSYQTVPGGNGIDYAVIGGVSLSKDTAEIKYFGRD